MKNAASADIPRALTSALAQRNVYVDQVCASGRLV
jgi:hypothetical protein